MSQYYLGIDTSNYKTSVAVSDSNGSVVFSRSEYLEVEQGERGLRQSVAFFKQSNNLPVFIKDTFSNIKPSDIKAIGVSSRPRNIEGSYMPCFLAGCNAAHEIGDALDIPVYEFSHQDGHAAAILETSSVKPDNRVLFLHLSGGTTEFLLCENIGSRYNMKIIGETKDISIGQLIDRFGVKVGCSFPSGMELDKIAQNYLYDKKLIRKIKIDNGCFNLSGLETQLMRFADNSPDRESIGIMTSTLFYRISELIYETALQLAENNGIHQIYIAGGVASSSTVRAHISDFKQDKYTKGISEHNTKIIFGKPEFSGDNAVGISLLARKMKEDL